MKHREQAFAIAGPATLISSLAEIRVINCFMAIKSQLKTSFYTFPVTFVDNPAVSTVLIFHDFMTSIVS